MNPYELPMQKALVTIQRFGELTRRALGRKIKVDDEHIDEIINHLVSVNVIEWCTNYHVRFIYEASLHHAISIACPFCDVNITDDNMSMATDVKGNPICSVCFERNGDKCHRVDALVERKCERCGKVMNVRIVRKSIYCEKCALEVVHEGNVGKTRTDETKAKMSDTRTGTHPSKESIAKGAANRSGEKNWNYGRKLPDDVIAKMSKALTGRKQSQESIGKRADAQRGIPRPSTQGKNHPNWNGGSSFGKYCHKFNNRFKESIREKFGRKCFMCGRSEEDEGCKLSVHHVNYDKECMCNDVKCEFVPLCRKCHGRTHWDRNAWEQLILNVLAYDGWLDDGI